MSGKLVLVTGFTGFIGSLVVLKLLQAGYRVRGVTRTISRAVEFAEHSLIKPYASLISFAEVQDFTVPSAWEDTLKDVNFIIHTANPIPALDEENPTEEQAEYMYRHTLEGTMNLLRAAAKTTTVKRVVLSNTAAALLPGHAFIEGDMKHTYTAYTRQQNPPYAPTPLAHPIMPYMAAKAKLLQDVDQQAAAGEFPFGIVQVLLAIVLGANPFISMEHYLLCSANRVLSVVLGAKGRPTLSQACDVDEMADVHVRALDDAVVSVSPKTPRSFVTASPIDWNCALDLARERFPEAVEKGLLPLGGDRPTVLLNLDTDETSKVFGRPKPVEQMVVDTIAQYLELVRGNGVPEFVASGKFASRVY